MCAYTRTHIGIYMSHWFICNSWHSGKGRVFSFSQKAASVPWQTHKSFDFSAIKQKSFLKPVRSLSLCSFGKCILCWNKLAVRLDKKVHVPWMCVLCDAQPEACHGRECSHWAPLAGATLSMMFTPWGPASVALTPPLRTSKFHPRFLCDSPVWRESKGGRSNEADSS